MSVNEHNLIWVDMEMTGLEPMSDKVLEIATVITDSQLNVLAEGPVIAVHQDDETLGTMDNWCTNTHTRSGLVDRVRASKINEKKAQTITLEFLEKWSEAGASPMCGNSIGQDRRFMHHHLPHLESFFHYRNLDVSTIKELARRWRPDVLAGVKKTGTHLALDDILESIEELRHYQAKFFNLNR